MIELNNYLCKGCEYCVKFCPRHILKIGEERNSRGHFYPIVVDSNECTSCGICALVCPEGAIEIPKKEMTSNG